MGAASSPHYLNPCWHDILASALLSSRADLRCRLMAARRSSELGPLAACLVPAAASGS